MDMNHPDFISVSALGINLGVDLHFLLFFHVLFYFALSDNLRLSFLLLPFFRFLMTSIFRNIPTGCTVLL